MKRDLIRLLEKTDEMEEALHAYTGNVMRSPFDQTMQEFQGWAQALLCEFEDIYDKTNNTFIGGIVQCLSIRWTDEGVDIPGAFSELKGKLNVVRDSIDRYYPEEFISSEEEKLDKPSKIFISHASKDKEYVQEFVTLLEFIGIRQGQLFCSSVSGYDIPEGENIYDYLSSQFHSYNLHMFYMLSDHYYESAAALNEMGAAWILKTNYTTILLPGFEYTQIEGAVDPEIISAKLGEDKGKLKSHLSHIKTSLESEFNLTPLPQERWEKVLETFIEKVADIEKKVSASAETQQNTEHPRSPNLVIDVGDGWDIHYMELDNDADNQIRSEYAKLTMEDVAAGQAYVQQHALDKYNAELPSKDEVEDYIKKFRGYILLTEGHSDIPFDIINEGSCKATAIHVSLKFPEEVSVIKKSEIENIQEPERPHKPENPIEKDNPLIQFEKQREAINTLLQGMSMYPNEFSYEITGYGIEVEENCIQITINNLQHKRRKTYNEFAVIAKKRGNFRAECTLICEEYEEPVQKYIDFTVV